MRIVIETDPTTPLQVATGAAETALPVVPAADAGAGPSVVGGNVAAAPTAELDAGGPPDWLTAAITHAMSESSSDFGEAPQTTAGADAANAEDGGSGPALA